MQQLTTLGPGDVVEVKFFYTQQLNETQAVRPDNKISLQLVGDVDVAGKTPQALRAKLLEIYAPLLRDPEISVLVRSQYNRRVYVGGEVNEPGLVEMHGPLTALEAIMEVGGFDWRAAEAKNVIVIRHNDSGRRGYALDLRSALRGQLTEPFYLEPRDIVYIPRTTIAKVDQWIDQHINKLVPQTGFTYSVPVGTGRIGVDTSAR